MVREQVGVIEPRLVPGSLVRGVVGCDLLIGVSLLLWAMLLSY